MQVQVKDRKQILREVLSGEMEEILEFAVDQGADYSEEKLAEYLFNLHEDVADLPADTKLADLEEVLAEFSERIEDAVRESFEPLGREEALKDIYAESARA